MKLKPINPPLRDGQRVVCCRCSKSVSEALADLNGPAGSFYCSGCVERLAELGAKCLEQLTCAPWYGRDEKLERLDKLTMIETAARDLGLLPDDDEGGKA